MKRVAGFFVCLAAGALGVERDASACGCFTAPNPAEQVVQAGEQLVFAVKNGVTTAHIRVQYSGKASEFGWLLPLPSVPTLELGTDELFSQLSQLTRPRYLPTVTTDPECANRAVAQAASGGGCGGSLSDNASSLACDPACPAGSHCTENGCVSDDADGGVDRVVVILGAVGPYDYAVLKADDKTDMLAWLMKNRYFVPDAIGTAVTPYIHPGAYFLALKLRAGESTGSLLPVVVHYASDLPMIPLVLTSVGATPKMPIEVYVLGQSRAIPRNYHHVVVNEAAIDYATSIDYPKIAVDAVGEAPKRHGFITEFAGDAAIMKGVLDRAGRFGDPAVLKALRDPVKYVAQLKDSGFVFGPELYGVLERYIPEPDLLRAQGVTQEGFYADLGYWLQRALMQNGDAGLGDGGLGADFNYDPVALTDELWMRIVTPTLSAARLFVENRYLTRLFTALSPEDMTSDPVFDFNPDLPPLPVDRGVQLRFHCTFDSTVTLRDGTVIEYPNGRLPVIAMPHALRIEVLSMTGPPQVVTSNADIISAALKSANETSLAEEKERDARLAGGGNSGGLQIGCALARHRFAGAEICLAAGLLAFAFTLRRRGRRP